MKKLTGFLLIHVGLLLVTAGIVLFKLPNKFATGGVTGIVIVLNQWIPQVPAGLLMLIINSILLIIGLIWVGLEFEIKTLYSTIMLSIFVWIFEQFYPNLRPLTNDTMLELVFAIILLAAGSSILFYQNASSGGTDIIAKILNKKTQMHIGKTLLMVDLFISIFAIFLFGVRIGMYSIFGVIAKGLIIDAVIQGLHTSKYVFIISENPHEIKSFILHGLQRGLTVYHATGGKTNMEKEVIHSVISKRELVRLRNYLKTKDQKAFVIISNVSEIIGKGFKNYDL